MRNQSKREEVSKEIRESFALNKYPGDSQLLELDPKVDPDSGDIFEALQGKSWQELLAHLAQIDGPDLYWFCWVYSLLTPDAFYYYLPAFLIISLDLERVDTVGDHLIYFLRSSDKVEDAYTRRYADEVTIRSTPSQRIAIQNWVRYLLEEYPEFPQVIPLQDWL